MWHILVTTLTKAMCMHANFRLKLQVVTPFYANGEEEKGEIFGLGQKKKKTKLHSPAVTVRFEVAVF